GARRFSRALAVALAEDTSLRLDLIDQQRLVPRGTVRRPALALVAAAGAYLICWLTLPDLVRAGWGRLLTPPPAAEPSSGAAPVAQPPGRGPEGVREAPGHRARPAAVPAGVVGRHPGAEGDRDLARDHGAARGDGRQAGLRPGAGRDRRVGAAARHRRPRPQGQPHRRQA